MEYLSSKILPYGNILLNTGLFCTNVTEQEHLWFEEITSLALKYHELCIHGQASEVCVDVRLLQRFSSRHHIGPRIPSYSTRELTRLLQ